MVPGADVHLLESQQAQITFQIEILRADCELVAAASVSDAGATQRGQAKTPRGRATAETAPMNQPTGNKKLT